MSSSGDHLRALARRAETEGGRAAAHAMAQEGQAAIREALSRRAHPRGTPTPAPAGGPPAWVSGRLASSVIASMPRQEGAGRWVAEAGPQGVVYARIQNSGGTIRAHGKALTFFYDGGWHRVSSVTLPARPYIAPPVAQARASGRIERAGAEAFRRAVNG